MVLGQLAQRQASSFIRDCTLWFWLTATSDFLPGELARLSTCAQSVTFFSTVPLAMASAEQ